MALVFLSPELVEDVGVGKAKGCGKRMGEAGEGNRVGGAVDLA